MPATEARFQCRHILADGHRCRSACLRHEDFCYYHHASRRPVANPLDRKGRRATFTLPRIEDRASILLAINEILTRIAANDIDARRAGRLLYALQIAACSMPRPAALKPSQEEDPGLVEEVVLHPTLGEIAPRSELVPPEPEPPRKTLAQELREEMEALEARNILEFGASAEDKSDTEAAESGYQRDTEAAESGCPILSGLIGKGGVSSAARPPFPSTPTNSAGCPILSGLIGKGGVSSAARPPSPSTPTNSAPISLQISDIPSELREAREELESRQDRIHGMHQDLDRYSEDLAQARAQLADARADTLRAEESMVWHMDRHAEARAQLDALQPAEPQPEPATLPRLEAAEARCPILSGLNGKGGVSSEARPPSSSTPQNRVLHLRDGFIVAKVGIERSSTAFPAPSSKPKPAMLSLLYHRSNPRRRPRLRTDNPGELVSR